MSALTDLTVRQSLDLLRSGEISSRELTEAALGAIDSLEPRLHAFITLTPELALRQAQAADQRWRAWRADPGQPPPGLLGIPVAVKDVLALKGVR